MSIAKIKNIEIAYEDLGAGEPLILICGYSAVKETWGPIINGLSRHLRVITFDNRGVGGTTVPSKPYTLSDMAGDVIGLMDVLELQTAHIMGVSMGGLITQLLALDYPQRIKSIALGCTTHGGKKAISADKKVMQLLAKTADPAILPQDSLREKVKVLYSPEFIKKYNKVLDGIVSMGLQHYPTPQGAAGQMKALSYFNARERLVNIKCPALVLTGDQDQMMPPENSYLLASKIPDARLHIIKGAGHSFFQENSEETLRILTDFIYNQ